MAPARVPCGRTGNLAGGPVTDQPLLSAGLLAGFNREVIFGPVVWSGWVAGGRKLAVGQDIWQATESPAVRFAGDRWPWI